MEDNSTIETNQHTQTPILEIKAIQQSRNEMIRTKEKIREFVEPPLVNACEHLWDLNVRTLSSSANAKDIDYEAYVIIDFDTLSEQNKITAQEEGKLLDDYDGKPAVIMEIPVTQQTTAEELKEKFSAKADRFEKQRATWIPSFSLQEIKHVYFIDPDDEQYGINNFVEDGLYYDPEGKRFYLSEEHFQKATEEIIS